MMRMEKDIIEKCKEFAEKVTETTFDIYSGRNYTLKKEDAIKNHFMGKLAEVAVYNFLTENGHVLTEVDFEITKNKSHARDLLVIGPAIKLHVKCCKLGVRSWVFESNCSYVKKPKANDFLVLCEYDDEQKIIFIKSLSHASNYEFFPTMKNMGSKVAIYLD